MNPTTIKERFHQDEVSIEDFSEGMNATADDELEEHDHSDTGSDDDFEVPQSELEKVRMLLRGRQEVDLEIPMSTKPRKFCQSHRKFRKQALKQKREKENKEKTDKEMEDFKPPEFTGKNEYLYYVKAQDGIKNQVQWKHGLRSMHNIMDKTNKNPKKKKDNKAKRTSS